MNADAKPEAWEKEHLGDADLRTGIYTPTAQEYKEALIVALQVISRQISPHYINEREDLRKAAMLVPPEDRLWPS